jgi:EAL domain-containing protein (putative c-di-GMP-specific phosphodiesterase class I)/GGDEF domain-containing protein
MKWFIDDYEYTALKRIYLGITIIFIVSFGLTTTLQLISGFSTGHYNVILPLRLSALILNVIALILFRTKFVTKERMMPIGIVLAAYNFIISRIILVLQAETPYIAAMSYLFTFTFIVLLGLYTHKLWISISVALVLATAYILVYIVFRERLFLNAIPAEAQGTQMFITGGMIVVTLFAEAIIVQSVNDILYHQIKTDQEYLQTLAYFDQQTGLPNGRWLDKNLGDYLSTKKSTEGMTILAGIRIDGIMKLNERLGYDETNQWLTNLTTDLAMRVQHWATKYADSLDKLPLRIYRVEPTIFMIPIAFNDDEIAFNIHNAGELRQIVIDTMEKSQFGSQLDFSGAFTVYPEDAQTPENLQRNILTILHRNTQTDLSTFVPFNKTAFDLFLRQERILELLAKPSFTAEIRAVFQPKILVENHRCTGFEALARWKSPELGNVPPGEFIQFAERSHAIELITNTILRETERFIAEIRAEMDTPFRVSINLSPILFETTFLNDLIHWIEQRKIGKFLELEITESTILRINPAISESFSLLRNVGVHFSIDDFGTGYSNLAYIQDFEADVLKLDKRFIDGLPSNPKNANLVRAILHMAQSFNMSTVAEGVEYAEQEEFLAGANCEQIQGYLFSKPLEASDALRFFLDHPGDDA